MKHKIHELNISLLNTVLFSMILCVLTLLNGCSSLSKDGPPPYDVDVSKIPNAQPKAEKLSKYGNMPVYRVNGKNYYVMNSSKNYEAEGVASWYGTKFHRRNTSSGEKYNMLAMTAAHRTLPLPTYLQVINKENGKTVIVKVNDRGPFADNRLLDLSYAAAKKLGMIGHGTANVAIKAIDPKTYHPEEIYTNSFYIVSNKGHSDIQLDSKNASDTVNSSTFVENTKKTHATFQAKQLAHAKNNMPSKYLTTSPNPLTTSSKQIAWNKPIHSTEQLSISHYHSHVYLQVGAFSNKSYAERLKKQLSPIVASSVQITEHGHPKKLYRVQIGPIKDQTTVSQINKQLKSIGLSGRMLFV